MHKSLSFDTCCCSLVLQAGSHTPLQHIHGEYAEIRGRNEMQQARVEDILSQRLAVEQRTKQVSIRQHMQYSEVQQGYHSDSQQPG
jgi:hypothetical protein